MKKRVFNQIVSYAIAGVLSTMCISGCGTKKTDAGLTEDGKVLLEISTVSKDVNEKSYNDSMDKYSRFEEYYKTEYPDSKGVSIKPHYYNYNVRDYAAVAAGGQLATYYYVPMTEAKAVMDAGYAKDITPWMEKYGYLQGMDEKVRKNIERDGKIYLLPYQVYAVGLAVNLDILEEAGYVSEDGTPHQPETFEELAQMAGDIKKKTGKAGFIMPTTTNGGGWRFTPIAWAYGVDFMEQDTDGNWQATFNTPECIEALQWLKDLKWKYDALPENILIDIPKQRSAFGSGEAAMAFGDGSIANEYMQAGMNKDSLGFIHMPAGPKRHVTLTGGSYYVFNANATDEQIDAAFKYLDWNGQGRRLDDEVKENLEKDVKLNADNGALIGVLNASPYTEDDPKRAYQVYLSTEKMVNINMNHVKLYNNQSNIEWQAEEPIEAQALYAVLDNAIQAVLTDKNADCAKLIDEACKNFQVTLDTVNNS